MKHSSRLPATTASVTGARDFVTNSLESVPKDVLDAVLVVTSELTSNSVLHGGSSFEITVEQFTDRIVVEVQAHERLIRAMSLGSSKRGLGWCL